MDLLLTDGLRPFSILAGFIVLLLVAEIILMMIGTSSHVEVDSLHAEPGSGLDGHAGHLDGGVDVAAFEGADFSPHELALLDLAPAERQAATPVPPTMLQRLLRLAGIGSGPLLVSLTCLAAGVSALGYFLQLMLGGAMLPGWMALAVVLLPGLWLGGRLAGMVARLVPAYESHGISGQTFHGRRGLVVIGTARRDEPAQVRWRDSYGTTHSLMAEPLRDGESIPQGAEVLIVKTRDRQPRIVTLDHA